jgi:predicted amidohydrolase YtcJ
VDLLGKLKQGKEADLAVLSQGIFAVLHAKSGG